MDSNPALAYSGSVEPDLSPLSGGDKLAQRRRKVLAMVIQEYVETAQPIGSKTIADASSLGVSPATIRNDLAALEQAGLLTHPHTSAGRVPTEAGYRYYVRHLLVHSELPSRERRTIRHQFHQSRQELDQWLRLSTAVLAQASRSAALATGLRATHSRFKHLELISIRDAVVLLVLVLQEGTVKQQLLTLDDSMDQSDLSRVSNELNERLDGATWEEICQQQPTLSAMAQEVARLVSDIIERLDGQSNNPIYRDGLSHVLEAPEFSEGDNVRKIVQVFEERSALEQILGECQTTSDVQVFIAGEGRYTDLANISLVLSSYGIKEHATGVLGVIGPLRMSYGRSIGAVRFVSMLMSQLVRDIYGL